MTSTELVPRTYAREAYNSIHGTELRTHTDALTAPEAAFINDTYDIELYVGIHGIVPDVPLEEMTTETLAAMPTQLDYDEAAAVVARGYAISGRI